MPVETLFPEESKSHDQHENGLHMTKYLEGHGRKSADADELAEISADCNGAGE